MRYGSTMDANSKHEGRPSEYRGPLTPGQVAEGMNAAMRDARRLATDAKHSGRLPSADIVFPPGRIGNSSAVASPVRLAGRRWLGTSPGSGPLLCGLRTAREGDSGQVFPPHLARGEFDIRQMRKLLVAMRHFLRLAESVDEVQDKSCKAAAPIAVAGLKLQGSCGHGPP
jgi:hypothetical protein